MLALIFFGIEFNFFINKNILTKEELEYGWHSSNRAFLLHSYYLLIASLVLIIINIIINYYLIKLKTIYKTKSNRYNVYINKENGLKNNVLYY